MSFSRLTDLVLELRRTLATIPPGALPPGLRDRAATLALAHFGEAPMHVQSLVNVAGLAVSLGTPLEIHEVRREAIELVHDVDVRTLPAEPPRLLRAPFVIESRGDARLFGDVVSLGGYGLDGAWYLVALKRPDGAAVWRWLPQWQEREVIERYEAEASPLVADSIAGEYNDLYVDTIRFLVTLALLLDAHDTPIARESERRTEKASRKNKSPQSWTVRHVKLAASPVTTSRPGTPSVSEMASVDASGRALVSTRVRGHVRMQPFGPGRAERRLVYVAEHDSRRWCTPQRRVVVGV